MEITKSTENATLLGRGRVSRKDFNKLLLLTTIALGFGGTAAIAGTVPPTPLDTAPAVPPVPPAPPVTPGNPGNFVGLINGDEGNTVPIDAIGKKEFPSIRLTLHEFTNRSPGLMVIARNPGDVNELTLLAAKYATTTESIRNANPDPAKEKTIRIPTTQPELVSPATDDEYMKLVSLFLDDLGRYHVISDPKDLQNYDEFNLRLRLAVANHTYTEMRAINAPSREFKDFQRRVLSALSHQQSVLTDLKRDIGNATRRFNFTKGDINNLVVAKNPKFDKLLNIMLPPPPQIKRD